MSEAGKELLVRLTEYYGVTQGSVIEMLVRDRARQLKIPLATSELPPGA